MTPDEIRLWQAVVVARAQQERILWKTEECVASANAAVAAFREANKREPEPNAGRL